AALGHAMSASARALAIGDDPRMLSLRRVEERYYVEGRWKTVLAGITFTIPFGADLGIVGGNGSGKSTLMRLLAGVEAPTRGEVTHVGSVSWPLASGAGMSPNLTGEENARFIARLYGIEPKECLDFVRDFSELGPALKEEMFTYSSGMRAR